jgi:hypothetical protein
VFQIDPLLFIKRVDYATLGDKEEYKLKNTVDRLNVPDANGNIEMEITLIRMAIR